MVLRLAQRWSCHWLSLGIVIAVLVFDQMTKLWLLFEYDLFAHGSVALGPFFDLVAVWNRGISYGWLGGLDVSQHVLATALGVFALCVGLLLIYLAMTSPTDLARSGYALIAGGALGNGIDRFLHGAVFDFLHFHVGSFSWYVFNFADVAVCAGVIGLVFDMILSHKDAS